MQSNQSYLKYQIIINIISNNRIKNNIIAWYLHVKQKINIAKYFLHTFC